MYKYQRNYYIFYVCKLCIYDAFDFRKHLHFRYALFAQYMYVLMVQVKDHLYYSILRFFISFCLFEDTQNKLKTS